MHRLRGFVQRSLEGQEQVRSSLTCGRERAQSRFPGHGRPPFPGAPMMSFSPRQARPALAVTVSTLALLAASVPAIAAHSAATSPAAVKSAAVKSAAVKWRPSAATATPVKHLVVIYQENVSFDHYFATYPHAANTAGEPVFRARP